MFRRRATSTEPNTDVGSNSSPERPADDGTPLALPHLVDGHDPSLAADEPGVAHLAARFGVERILLQQQLHPFRRRVLPEREDLGVGRVVLVADELLPGSLQLAPLDRLRHDRRVRRRSPRPTSPRRARRGTACAAPPAPPRSRPGPPRRHAPRRGSCVRSIGKPKVSYSRKASSPGMTVSPLARSSSIRLRPPSMVSRKRCSSVRVHLWIRPAFVAQFGIDGTHLARPRRR